jgi:hypothetical protein
MPQSRIASDRPPQSLIHWGSYGGEERSNAYARPIEAIEKGEERITDNAVETYKPVSENEVAFQ